MRFAPGSSLGPYEIIGVAGVGGMGEVYKARDNRLNRSVALKVLPAGLSADKTANERFLIEARAASSCDHPNICTIYEVGEIADGHLYLAMAFYEGETLRERLLNSVLTVQESVTIAMQVASGLARAHEAGLVHRDIKPANIMITTRGEVKILDFGLAKLTRSAQLTQTGFALGTVAYMSPEQAGGQPVDHRTDLWALGVVLYEMVSGRRPYDGDTAGAVFSAILSREPDPLVFSDGLEHAEVRRIVERALARDRNQRYPDAATLFAALAAAAGTTTIPTLAARPQSAPTRRADPQAVTVLVPADTASIAVLPFSDLSPERDQAWFCDGVSEEIMTALTKVQGLRVVARTSSFKFRDSSVDAREIGTALQVKHLLTGGVRKVGERLRVTVQLIDAANGYQVWTERYDATLDNVFDIQDRIAVAATDQLRVRLGTGQAPLVRRPAASMEAYHLYLRGRHHLYQWTAEGTREAVDCFNRAIAVDPAFAQPYAGLADVYLRQAIAGVAPPRAVMPKAKELVLKALEFDDQSADVHSSLGWIQYAYEWDFDAAERSLTRSVDLPTGNEVVRGRYSMFLNEQGYFERGIAEAQRALSQSPVSADAHMYLIHALYVARHFHECIDLAHHALSLQPLYFPARWYKALAHGGLGQHEAALDTMQVSLPAWHPFNEGLLGWALALAGRTEEARQIAASLVARRAEGHFSAPAIASVYVGLGELDTAMDWYDTAYEERDPHCLAAKVFPSWDPLRSHPRFAALLDRMHFPVVHE